MRFDQNLQRPDLRHDHHNWRDGQNQNQSNYQPQTSVQRPGSPSSQDGRSWARWQQVHPGSSIQDYKNWYSQYGSQGDTISGEAHDRLGPFYNHDKNQQYQARREGVENHVRSRNFATLRWMTNERRNIWNDIVARRDSVNARQLIQTYEQEGDLDHGEWLRAQLASWGGATPNPVSNPHAAWLHRRGHRISTVPPGGFRPPPPVSPPELEVEGSDIPETTEYVENAALRSGRPAPPHRAPEAPRPPELNPTPPDSPQPFAGEFGLGTDIPSSKTSSGWLANFLKPSSKTTEVAPVIHPAVSDADAYLIQQGLMPEPITVHGEFGVAAPAAPRGSSVPRAPGRIAAPISSYRTAVQAPHSALPVRSLVSRPILAHNIPYSPRPSSPEGRYVENRYEQNQYGQNRYEQNQYGQNQYGYGDPYQQIAGQAPYEGTDTTIYVAPPLAPTAPDAPTSDDSGIVSEVLSGVKGLLGMKDASPPENDDGSDVSGEFGHPGGSQNHQNQKRPMLHPSHPRIQHPQQSQQNRQNQQNQQNQQQGGSGGDGGGYDDGSSGGDDQYSDDGSGDMGSEGWTGRRQRFSVNGGREERNNFVNAPIVSRGFYGGRYAWHNGDYVYVEDSNQENWANPLNSSLFDVKVSPFMGELQQLASWSRGGDVPDFDQGQAGGIGELRQLSSWARGRQKFNERSPFGIGELQQLASWSRGGRVPDFEQNNSGIGEMRQLSSWARGRQNFSERSPFGVAEMGTRSTHEEKKHSISAGWSGRRKQSRFQFGC